MLVVFDHACRLQHLGRRLFEIAEVGLAALVGAVEAQMQRVGAGDFSGPGGFQLP